MRCRTRCLTCARRRLSRWLLRRILIGFFQIATQIGRVFEVDFPEDVKRVLKSMEVVVTLGFDVLGTWTPLACAGMGGYAAQLRFWAITPFVLVLMILIGTALLLMMQKVKVTLAAVLLTAAPIVLQLFFLVFPVVTREAFEAFPCHEFNDGRGYLRADVAVECDTDDHDEAVGVAVVAIICYPVGLLLLFGTLLAYARRDIIAGRETPLAAAIAFLHKEYDRHAFWWELMEMLRRFLLVGVLVTVRQGSIEQLAYGNLIAIIYAAIQAVTSPYRKPSDDFFAAALSLALAVLLLCATFFKYAALTELGEMQAVMVVLTRVHSGVKKGGSGWDTVHILYARACPPRQKPCTPRS